MSGGDAFDAANPGQIRVWDAQTGKELYDLSWAKGADVHGVAFGADGRWVAACCGGVVKVWHLPR